MRLSNGFNFVLAAVLIAAGAYGAAQPQPWEKPVDAWTAQDVAALLNNSPWSLQSLATMEDPEDTREPEPAGPPDTGDRGPGKRPWDGGPGRYRMGHLGTLPVTVRWESALPIRQAQKDLAVPADSYVISLSGLIPPRRYRAVGKMETSSSSDDSVDARNPEEILEAFMVNSMISQKAGADLGPENVKLDPATGVIRIYFSRKTGIDPGQKEVVFITHFGKLHVKAKFRLTAMKYHGNIEL